MADVNAELVVEVAINVSSECGEAVAFPVHVTGEESVQTPMRSVMEEFGRIDARVNNAGAARQATPCGELPGGEWDRVLAIDLNGVYYGCRAVLPFIPEQGRGRIVNV